MSRGLGKLQVELLRIIEQDDMLVCTYTLAALGQESISSGTSVSK
jgi:hypothetical protein